MNAYEQKKAQLALILSIRETLPAGYSAFSWGQTQICIRYTPAANPDACSRWYVQDEHEWAVIKAQLGLL